MSKNKKKNKKNSSDALGTAMANAKVAFSNVSEKSKKKTRDILIFIGATIVILCIFIYFFSIGYFVPVFVAYLIIWSAAVLSYWIYNRGMINANISPDELSPNWSAEKKEQFIRSIAKRREKSRWLLFIIAPITFVFLMELFINFVLPAIYSIFE